MKPNHRKTLSYSRRGALISYGLIGAVLCAVSAGQSVGAGAAENEPGRASVVASAESTSFNAVASHLDAGGNLYVYLSTEQWLAGLSDKIAGLKQVLDGLPLGVQERLQVDRIFSLVTSVVKHSGVEEVSGVGMSSLATEKGFYRNKTILHHYPGKNTGYLWSLFGRSPHALNGLDLLPENTAVAGFGDFNLPLLWKALQDEASRAEIKEATEFLGMLPAAFEARLGIKFDDFLNSLGNEYGLVLTLDEKKPLTLPVPSGTLEIPEPGLMLIVRVKNDLLLDRVDEFVKQANLSQQVASTDKDGLKMRSLEAPLPLPLPLRPTLARSGEYLFLATSDNLIQEALSVQKGQKNGFKSTADFQRLARGLPRQGNQFFLLSRRFGDTVTKIQTSMLNANPTVPPAARTWVATVLSGGTVATMLNVSALTEEGWVSVANGNKDLRTAVLLPSAVIPAGMLAAIAVPNFVKARAASQRNACVANLRMLDGAKEQWALEKKKKTGDEVKMSDLVPDYVRSEPRCPAGTAAYTLNPIGTSPACPNCNPNDPELSRHKLGN